MIAVYLTIMIPIHDARGSNTIMKGFFSSFFQSLVSVLHLF